MRWAMLFLLAVTLVIAAPAPAAADNFSIRIGYDSGPVFYSPPVYREYRSYSSFGFPTYYREEVYVSPWICPPSTVFIYDRPLYRPRYLSDYRYYSVRRPYTNHYVVRPIYRDRHDHDRDWDRRDWDRYDRNRDRDHRDWDRSDRDRRHDEQVRWDRDRDRDPGRRLIDRNDRTERRITERRESDWTRSSALSRNNDRVWRADSRSDSIRKSLIDDRGRSAIRSDFSRRDTDRLGSRSSLGSRTEFNRSSLRDRGRRSN
ncbi:MAG TPA: hypothetical protein PK847_05910 [Candidatus Sumerlaeota bacterium]|nr:hypothetical protein [Candidatus Sumerlaeota bacterium]